MNALEVKQEIIQLQKEKISDLEAQLVKLKYEASLARKSNKKGKRKAPKFERRGKLIVFPTNRKAKESS